MTGIEGLAAGDVVTAEQMQALFGSGHHPLAAQRREQLQGPGLTDRDYQGVTRLGVPFKVFSGGCERVPVGGGQADRRCQRGRRAAR
jgi:CO dehydrogenase/acetyl-CoA synthase beta subunit